MTTSQTTIVEAYLARLDAAAAVLPPDRRTELVEEIRQHIADALGDALGDADARSESAVRNVLDRLGPPAEIIAAEAPLHESTAGPAAPMPAAPVPAALAPAAPKPGRRTAWVIAGLAVLVLTVLAFLTVFAASESSAPVPASPGISEQSPSPS